MRKFIRFMLSLLLVVATTLASIVATQSVASASSFLSVPNISETHYVTAPNGEITVGCNQGRDLKTYDQDGNVTRQLSSSQQIDGVNNCIGHPVVDQTGALYGIPRNLVGGAYGPNLLKYSGENLQWKYPIKCNAFKSPVAIGLNGIVYATSSTPTGTRLIGLMPTLLQNQLEPTKVLDIPIDASCEVDLYPHEGGIAIRDLTAYPVRFLSYDYDGELLSEQLGLMDGAINASGQLFSIPSSSTHIMNVRSAAGQSLWNYQVTDQTEQLAGVNPLPNGGVMLTLYRTVQSKTTQIQRMLDSSGNIVGTDILLPLYISSTVSQGTARVVVNDVGQVIILQARTNWQTGDQVTTITTLSPSNRVVRQDVIPDYGFFFDQTNAVKISGSKIYFQAQMDANSFSGVLVDYDMLNVGYDYPRSAILIDSQSAPALNYVAMGDSFSSGESNEAFDPLTAVDEVNQCHRSEYDAYPKLLADDQALNLRLVDFTACAGATTNNVWGYPNPGTPSGGLGLWNEQPQIDALTSNTDIVTITAGGNDIGFKDYAKSCIVSTCGVGTSSYIDTLAKINNVLPGDLEGLYRIILSKATKAKLYVIGYPQMSNPMQGTCWAFDGQNPQGAYNIVAAMNHSLGEAVNAIKNDGTHPSLQGRIEYVEVNNTSNISPFAGHELCSVQSYFRGIYYFDQEYSFHPNELGQQAYKTLISAAIG